MFKKFIIVFLFLIFFLPNVVLAEENIELDFFFSETCPVCANEDVFLLELEEEFPTLIINRYNIADSETINKMVVFYKKYNISQDAWGLVPATFIVDKAYLGFSDKTAEVIRNQVISLFSRGDGGNGTDITNGTIEEKLTSQLAELKQRKINIPFLGEFSVAGLSPFGLSMAVGILDGFNACAMVALGILLTIIVSTGTRKRVILIGGTFILVSGVVYYIFIAAWLNIFLFLGYIKIITYIVAVTVILFALFLLRDYINGVICKICNVDLDGKESWLTRTQRYLFSRANRVVSSQMPLVYVLISIAVIAAGINMVELFCSLGFPLAYTKILAGHNLPSYQYYLYLLVYIVFYMIDDFLIFLVAVFTLRITKVSEKYLKFVKLASGVILLILGLVMIFRPDILTF